MLPLQHLRPENMGNSQTPNKRLKRENKNFTEKHFSFSDENLKSEVFEMLHVQKNLLRTKLKLTIEENMQIAGRITNCDPMIEGWIDAEIGHIMTTLKEEMSCVLRNYFRAQIYERLTIKHCSNVFKYNDYQKTRPQNFPPSIARLEPGVSTGSNPQTKRPIILSKSTPKFPRPLRTSTPIQQNYQFAPFEHTPQKLLTNQGN